MNKLISYTGLLLSCLLLLTVATHSQDTAACTDISKIAYVKSIARQSSSVFIDKNDSLERIFTSLQFKPGMVHPGNIPSQDVTRKAILRFTLCNSSDSVSSIWFFPGFFYWKVNLYGLEGNELKKLPVETSPGKDNLSYRKISIAPHDTVTVYAELGMIKTYINTMRPRLVSQRNVQSFVTDLRAAHEQPNIITYLFCGLMLMMILFSIATYLQGANREFLYYSCYAFFVGVMLFTKALYNLHPNNTAFFLESYLDFIMQCIGHGFYMFFMKQFLSTKTHHPFLNKLYNFGIAFVIIAMVIFTFFHYFTDNYTAEYWTENITKFVLIGMIIAFIVYGLIHWKDKLLRYLFWGNLCLFIFSVLSQVLLMTEIRLIPGMVGESIFYYEIGLFLELVFFLSGLNHKNRRAIIEQTRERERLKTENQMKEYEKEIAVYKAQQEERQRISADMHDELGAGMTAIRLMSEIARNKMKQNTPVEIEKISHSADEVLNKMNAIIWSMDSGNDTLDNLVYYIRSYALEYFENTPIECSVVMPHKIEARVLSGDKRRNIFLCVKETLNNALKHSGANLIKIEFAINHSLVIKISDNGVGIDLQKIRQFGNGLKNINRRMESIGGVYRIENKAGTVTTLVLPL